MSVASKAVSKIEQSENVEDLTLERIAKALGISKEAIKSYNDEAVINLIQGNTFHDNSTAATTNFQCTFNAFDEIKRLNSDKEELFRALLKEKDEKIALMESVLSELKKRTG